MLVRNLVTGTAPGILHRNGNPPEWEGPWEEIVADFFREPCAPCEPCPDLTVLTWTNRPTQCLLERCLDRWGVPYLALGRRLPVWRNDMKLYLNVEALGQIESEYVMALDADDVLVVSPMHDILAAFKALECDLVFSAEKHNWPRVPFLADFEEPIAETTYRYLNSGAWIGRTETCRRFFQDCLQEDNGDIVAVHTKEAVFRDDQGLIRKTFQRYYPTARLDYHCRLFQSLTEVSLNGELCIDPRAAAPSAYAAHPASSGL